MYWRILIIEKDGIYIREISEALPVEKYAITVATSGERSLVEIRSTQFDLMILEVMIPSGWDVVKELRCKNYNFDHSLIVVTELEKDALLAMGISNYLAKPLWRRDLVEMVERVLDHSSQAEAVL